MTTSWTMWIKFHGSTHSAIISKPTCRHINIMALYYRVHNWTSFMLALLGFLLLLFEMALKRDIWIFFQKFTIKPVI